MADKKALTAWQLRLSADEDRIAERLAARLGESKNSVVKQALRLLGLIERERAGGARLLLERAAPNGEKEVVELWVLI